MQHLCEVMPAILCLFATPECLKIMYGSSKYGDPCEIGTFTHNFVACWCRSLRSAMAVWDTLFCHIVVHFHLVVRVMCGQVALPCFVFRSLPDTCQ